MVEIRRLQSIDPRTHFERIARLHIENIFHGALPFLGEPLLADIYRQLTKTPGAGIWVALNEGEIVGFIAGCCNVGAVFRSALLRTELPFLARAARQLMRPSLWAKYLAVLLYPLRSHQHLEKSPGKAGARPGTSSELLAMAVDSRQRRLGLGRRLIEAMEQELFMPNAVARYTVTTNQAEVASNRFYVRAGFEPQDCFRHHDLILQSYCKQLASQHD